MKTLSRPEETEDAEMLDEYRFTGGVRGKYAARYAKGTNMILLAPDLMDVFPNAEAVNEALRPLAALIRERVKCIAGPADPSSGGGTADTEE